MATEIRAETTQRLEHWVHRSLLTGVLLSTLLLVAGLGAHLTVPKPPAVARSSWTALLEPGGTPLGTGLLDAGLAVLMATPLVRVAVLATGWLAARQYRLGSVALVVLALLVLSMLLGHA
jgi:uncharacterized membrane protein